MTGAPAVAGTPAPAAPPAAPAAIAVTVEDPRPTAANAQRLDRALLAVLAGLALASVATLAIPGLRVGYVAPGLDIIFHTTTTVVTASVAALALAGFRVRGGPAALFQACALLVLALANGYELVRVFSRAIEIPSVILSAPGESSAYVSTATRLFAGALLVVGAGMSISGRDVRAPRRVFATAVGTAFALIVIGHAAGMSLPPLGGTLDPPNPLPPGVISATLPAGTALGAFLGLVTGAMLLWAGAWTRLLYRRVGAIGDAYFAVGLVFAAFGELDLIFYPDTFPGVVTNGDLLRLGFVILLLLGIEAEAQATLHDLQVANLRLARLKDTEVERAAFEERSRLSRELHDGLAQDLWLAKLKAGRLASMSDLGPAASRLWAEVINAIDAGLAEARQAVLALRLVSDAEHPFRQLLAQTVDDFEDRYGLLAEFEAPPDLPRLPVRTEAELLRIAQEALSNVARHADATVVTIMAAVEDGHLVLSIRDNGKGFDPETAGRGRFGLGTMRERAELVGGSVVIDSRPLDGTRVVVRVPVATEGRRAAQGDDVTERTTPARLRVMLVDDHALVRSAVRQAISAPDLELVAEAASAEDALDMALQVRPDILLLDIDLPGMSGLQLVRELAPRLPETRIVMLTISTADRDLVEAIRNGAVGYLTKDLGPGELSDGVRAAYRGDLAMTPRMAARLVRRLVASTRRTSGDPDDPGLTSLSVREKEVLQHLAAGLTDREIASALGISPRTVETHVSSLLHKLGVRNRAEAAGRYRGLE